MGAHLLGPGTLSIPSKTSSWSMVLFQDSASLPVASWFMIQIMVSGRVRGPYCSNLATDKLLRLGADTVGGNDNIGFVLLAVVAENTSLVVLDVLVVVDDTATELDLDTKRLDLVDEHLVDERAHLESTRRSARVETLSLQTVGNSEGLDHLLTRVHEGLNVGIVETDRVVLLLHLRPVVEEAGSAKTHEVHVSGGVDCCIALEDSDIVALAKTFESSRQTCKTSTDNENVDARLGFGELILVKRELMHLFNGMHKKIASRWFVDAGEAINARTCLASAAANHDGDTRLCDRGDKPPKRHLGKESLKPWDFGGWQVPCLTNSRVPSTAHRCSNFTSKAILATPKVVPPLLIESVSDS
ncbi:monooxygenase, partial [Aureobasidium melanogenum]